MKTIQENKRAAELANDTSNSEQSNTGIWDGTVLEFVEFVRWALIFRELALERKKGWSRIALHKGKALAVAAERGYTNEAVWREIQRIVETKKEVDSCGYDKDSKVMPPGRQLSEHLYLSLEEAINETIEQGMEE